MSDLTIPAGVTVQAGGMDGITLAVQTMLVQQSAMATDLAAMRAELTRSLTRLEVIESQRADLDGRTADHESRLRAVERALPSDAAGRIAALERFRYTLAGLAAAGGILAGWAGQWIGQHLH